MLIRKLAHPAKAGPASKRRTRGATYGPEVVTALVKVWELFDYPCGQRLVPVMRAELSLRKQKEIRCSAAVADKLEHISPKTVDRLLRREKQVRHLRRNRNPAAHPLLYQRIPVKVAEAARRAAAPACFAERPVRFRGTLGRRAGRGGVFEMRGAAATRMTGSTGIRAGRVGPGLCAAAF